MQREFGFEGYVYKEFDRCSQYDINYTQLYLDSGSVWPQEANKSWPVSSCKDGWTYDNSEFENTLVTELDLVCDNQWWPNVCQTCFYVGSLFGNILFGYIADK